MHLTIRHSPELQKWVAMLDYNVGGSVSAAWVKLYDGRPSDFVALHDLLELQAKDDATATAKPQG
jgi:hypothetical protein